jgi:hypothetical protein
MQPAESKMVLLVTLLACYGAIVHDELLVLTAGESLSLKEGKCEVAATTASLASRQAALDDASHALASREAELTARLDAVAIRERAVIDMQVSSC